jgi:hypothetical protein
MTLVIPSFFTRIILKSKFATVYRDPLKDNFLQFIRKRKSKKTTSNRGM